jgi:hypothetical protein
MEGLEWLGGGGATSLGYSTDAVWLRFEVVNPTEEGVDALAKLPVARMSRLAWHVLDGDRVVAEARGGLEADAEERAMGGRFPSVGFSLPPGARRTVVLRAESDTSLRFPLQVSTALDYARHAARRDLYDYALVGVGATVLLFSLLNAWAQRSRLFGWLAVIAFGFLGYYFIHQGYYAWLGGPGQVWVNRQGMLACGMFGSWGFVAFTLECARGARGGRNPSRLRWVPGLMGAGAAALCAAPFRIGVWGALALLAVGFPCGAFAAFRSALKDRHRFGWALAAVWAGVMLVVFAMYANFLGLVPALAPAVQLQRTLLLMILMIFFALVTVHHKAARIEKEHLRRAEQLIVEARLEALRYQLNPHFLFNTLTSIDALSRQAPERIAALVRRLASYLRLRLDPAPDGRVRLDQEWESIRAYLDVEQVRFEDALRVRFEIEEAALRAKVPEMLLQPLVENAVKHGIPPEGALELCVCARREGARLRIRVENRGQLKPDGTAAPSGGGVGLRNLKDRLAHLYGDAARFDLREEAERVVAEVELPYEEEA